MAVHAGLTAGCPLKQCSKSISGEQGAQGQLSRDGASCSQEQSWAGLVLSAASTLQLLRKEHSAVCLPPFLPFLFFLIPDLSSDLKGMVKKKVVTQLAVVSSVRMC